MEPATTAYVVAGIAVFIAGSVAIGYNNEKMMWDQDRFDFIRDLERAREEARKARTERFEAVLGKEQAESRQRSLELVNGHLRQEKAVLEAASGLYALTDPFTGATTVYGTGNQPAYTVRDRRAGASF